MRLPHPTADDVPWQLSSRPRPEDIDLLGLSADETLEHARQLQADTRALRLVVSESLTAITRLTNTLRQRDRVISHQRDEIRELLSALAQRPAA